MVMALADWEQKRLDEVQRDCPALDAHLVSRGDGYLLTGYKGETDEVVISVKNESMAQLLRDYRMAYDKVKLAGWLSARGGRRQMAS